MSVDTVGRYAGPVEERIPGAPMHCHTTLPNHDCPQLRAGCLGCTLSGQVTSSPWVAAGTGLPLVVNLAALDMAGFYAALRRARKL